MHKDTFDRLASRTRMRRIALAMARRVLVDGLSAAAGREYGRPRDLANRAARRIQSEAMKEDRCILCGRPNQEAVKNGYK